MNRSHSTHIGPRESFYRHPEPADLGMSGLEWRARATWPLLCSLGVGVRWLAAFAALGAAVYGLFLLGAMAFAFESVQRAFLAVTAPFVAVVFFKTTADAWNKRPAVSMLIAFAALFGPFFALRPYLSFLLPLLGWLAAGVAGLSIVAWWWKVTTPPRGL